MKLSLGVIAYLILVVLISIGCASLLRSPNDPEMGAYDYTHRVEYVGVPKRTVHIWVDKNFSQHDKDAIDKAVESWNFALNGYVKLTVVDREFDMEIDKIVTQVRDNGWLFMKIDSDNTMIPPPDVKGNITIGFCERVGGNHLYIVRDRIFDDDVYGITMHEMGHLLGSKHVGNRLMYPTFTRARFQCIDFDTIKSVAGYQELPLEKLNFCVDKGNQIPVIVDDAGHGSLEL